MFYKKKLNKNYDQMFWKKTRIRSGFKKRSILSGGDGLVGKDSCRANLATRV